MIMCVITSFFDATMGRDDIFIGFANYNELFNDPVFWKALRNTLVIVVVSLLTQKPNADMDSEFDRVKAGEV